MLNHYEAPRDGSEMRELIAKGWHHQGALRRWDNITDQQYQVYEKQFDQAVAKARAEGKQVQVIEHDNGKDWLFKEKE